MGIIWCLRRFLTSVCILLLIGATSDTKTQSLDSTAIEFGCYQSKFLIDLNTRKYDHVIINIALLRRDNMLFYSSKDYENYWRVEKVGFVSLDDIESGQSGSNVRREPSIVSVSNISFNAAAIGIDQENSIVYLGDTEIYQFDVNIYKVSYFGNYTINAVFYRNGLYFASENKIYYKAKNRKAKPILHSDSPIHKFIIANDGTIVYVNGRGVTAHRKNKSFSLAITTTFGFAIDLEEKVFAYEEHTMYELVLASVLNESRLVWIGSFHDLIDSMTFDNDNNILYTSRNSLYHSLYRLSLNTAGLTTTGGNNETNVCSFLKIGDGGATNTTIPQKQKRLRETIYNMSMQQTDHCDPCIQVSMTCYQFEYLFNLPGDFSENVKIRHLGVLRNENKLFYSYQTKLGNSEIFKVDFLYLTNGGLSFIKGGTLSRNSHNFDFDAFDFDQKNGIVYLNSRLGLYKLDGDEIKYISFSSMHGYIVAVFYGNGLYFVDVDEGNINFSPLNLKEGNSIQSHIIINRDHSITKFVITEDGTVVYICSAGVMAVRNKELVVLTRYPFFRGVTIDIYGNVYVWLLVEIYEVVFASVFTESKMFKIAILPEIRFNIEIGSITFDNYNNILFTFDNGLYRLSRTNSINCFNQTYESSNG